MIVKNKDVTICTLDLAQFGFTEQGLEGK